MGNREREREERRVHTHCFAESDIWNLFLISKHLFIPASAHRALMALNCSDDISEIVSGSSVCRQGMCLWREKGREGGREGEEMRKEEERGRERGKEGDGGKGRGKKGGKGEKALECGVFLHQYKLNTT